MRPRSRRILAAMAGALALGPGAAAAAGTVVAGATYRGTLRGSQAHVSISFRVSADGARIEDVTLGKLPIYCTGTPPPVARIAFRTAAIGAHGSFAASGSDTLDVGPLKGHAVATLALRGTFAAGGAEHGVLTTTYVGTAKRCDGSSAYTTRATP